MTSKAKSTEHQPMGRRERSFWWAAIAASAVHVLALGLLEHWGRLPEPEVHTFASVDFVDFEQLETRTMEEAVRERMEERMSQNIRNVSANAQSQRSEEAQSSRVDAAQMASDVEAELRAFEQAAFDALAEGRSPSESAAATQNAERHSETLDQYENWDARYEGQVTAEFDLAGRGALKLDVPGYRCRGGGVVVLKIAVAPGGEVTEAVVVSAVPQGGSALGECLKTESVKSAIQCRFQSKADAPRRQLGTLTYRFIAQ